MSVSEIDPQTYTRTVKKANEVVDTLAPELAISFLNEVHPGGPWLLFSFGKVRRSPQAHVVYDEVQLRKTLRRRQSDDWYVLLATLNEVIPKKPKKSDIKGSRWLWVDIDPDDGEELDSLEQRLLPFEPDVVVKSGRGIWGLWELRELSEPTRVEAANSALRDSTRADHCQNIDRIMRLPGTTNSKTGAIATWERIRQRAPRSVNEFQKTESDDAPSSSKAMESFHRIVREKVGGYTPLLLEPQDVYAVDIPPKAREAALTVPKGSRNELAFKYLTNCVVKNVPDNIIVELALCGLPVSNFFIFEKKDGPRRRDPEKFAWQQLQRAKNKIQKRGADSPKWEDTFKSGAPRSTYANARIGLEYLDIEVWHDDFSDRTLVDNTSFGEGPVRLSDKVLVFARDEFRNRHGFDPGKENLRDAFNSMAVSNCRDVVCEYLDQLEWDGVRRLDRWMIDVYGLPDNRYSREVGRLMICGMVQRVRKPGVKFDYMPILEGAQGAGKSLSLSILAGEFFSDAPIFQTSNSRDRADLLQGHWINEVAELDGLSKRDVTEVKSFVTQQYDEYRAAYAHHKERRPRRGILVGTTNDYSWNRDATGARRFLPVKCAKVDLGWLRENRDQLFAEADALEATSLYMPPEIAEMARQEQRKRQSPHPWDAYLDSMTPEHTEGGEDRVSTRYVMDTVLKLTANVTSQARMSKVLAERLRMQGWEGPKTMVFARGERRKGYAREAQPMPVQDREIPF